MRRRARRFSEWRDQSRLHNDAKQTTEMFAPRLAADPFGGMPGLEFTTKAWMMIDDDLSLRWGVLDFLVLVVYRATGACEGPASCNSSIASKRSTEPWPGPGLGIQPGGTDRGPPHHEPRTTGLTSPAAGYDSGRIHLVGAQRRSAGPACGSTASTFPRALPTVVVNLEPPVQNVYFGAHGLNPDPPIDFPFTGYIGAIVAVKGPISAADLAQLESYLMVKYGVGPAARPEHTRQRSVLP